MAKIADFRWAGNPAQIEPIQKFTHISNTTHAQQYTEQQKGYVSPKSSGIPPCAARGGAVPKVVSSALSGLELIAH